MKATVTWLGAVLLVTLTAGLAQANPWFTPCPPPAPDACGPYFFYYNQNGLAYGPSYWVRPPWEPFNGARPDLRCPPAMFGTHPYARSPRDYFMEACSHHRGW